MKYVTFLALCYKAYRGDVGAALEVVRIIKQKVTEAADRVNAS